LVVAACGKWPLTPFSVETRIEVRETDKDSAVNHVAIVRCVFSLIVIVASCCVDSQYTLRAESTVAASRPNLIVIMADDLGAKELSCYGHPEHRTPNLDRLARGGIQFATCYTACICHPTRFEIMTGQYGSTNGIYHFANRPGGPDPDSPEEQIVNHLTFGTVLKSAGYATALAGKWQLTGKVPTLVHECGFDEYCMWAYKHNLPPGVKHTGGWEGKSGSKTSRYWHPSILKNGVYQPTTMDDYGPDVFTDFVIDFARRHREEPFFIYFPMALTHGPHYSTPASEPNAKEKFRHSKQVKFRENVQYMDTLVGRIVDALEELGLRDNTLVMFTGDNGTGGEGKGQPTELGARVPMVINAPGLVKPVGLSDALVDTSDVLPTLVELAGASLPENHPLDGHSLVPILRGEKADVREWAFSYLGDRRVLRTKRWLLENNAPYDFGTLFDCGTNRDGQGYRDVTNSTDPEVLAVKRQFKEILSTKPVPDIPKAQRARAR
jgi:arylsulfatase A